MAKLHYRKVKLCSTCVYHYIDNTRDFTRRCVSVGQDIEGEDFPEWCPLIDYEEKIEANETENVWVKIRSKLDKAESSGFTKDTKEQILKQSKSLLDG